MWLFSTNMQAEIQTLISVIRHSSLTIEGLESVENVEKKSTVLLEVNKAISVDIHNSA